MSNKHVLRDLLQDRRRQMTEAERASFNLALREAVLAWCAGNRPPVLALYMPIRREPDLLPIAHDIARMGIRLALPVVVRPASPVEFGEWAPGQALQKDRVGVPAPVDGPRLQPDALLIPCLGYNSAQYRLGYGSGYYDRTLAMLPNARPIGIAWPGSQVDFDPDPCDLPMETVLTGSAAAR